MGAMMQKEELIEKFSDQAVSRKYLERAVDAVLEGRVKKQVFVPSGRILYAVVGRSGDEFIDPEKPSCSCQHFFFSVLGGRDDTCYHLLAYRIAAETHRFAQTEFHDEEFRYFLKLLSSDLLSRSGDKEDKGNAEPSDTGPR
jgi:predicted nucleic acid-binding Zn finger protein